MDDLTLHVTGMHGTAPRSFLWDNKPFKPRETHYPCILKRSSCRRKCSRLKRRFATEFSGQVGGTPNNQLPAWKPACWTWIPFSAAWLCGQIYISPHCAIVTSVAGLLSPLTRVFSTLCTTSIPSITLPKTTCLLFKNGVGTVVMKNWQPLLSLPELAMLSKPGVSCLS